MPSKNLIPKRPSALTYLRVRSDQIKGDLWVWGGFVCIQQHARLRAKTEWLAVTMSSVGSWPTELRGEDGAEIQQGGKTRGAGRL